MARYDAGLVGQSQQTRMNGVDDLFEAAAGKVCAADAAGKESVASEDHLKRRKVEANGSLSVTRSVDNLGWVVGEADSLAIGEDLVGRSGFWSGDAKPGCLLVHHLEQRQVVFVEVDGGAGKALEPESAANVVDVGVCDEDLGEFEAVIGEALMNAGDLIAGINDDGFARGFVGEDGAVALQRADGESLENHVLILVSYVSSTNPFL